MVQRTAILHIGTGKTGTTSIQRTLAANRATLLAAGSAYPESPGYTTHTRIAAFMAAGAEAKRNRLQLRAGSSASFAAMLSAEIEALPDSVRTVIFSNEHTYKQGLEPGAMESLRALLDPLFSDFQVIVYFRRQDELGVSRLSTRLKAGRSWASAFPSDPASVADFDYRQGLEPWIASFGKAAITPRIFAREDLLGGDVVRDFLETCSLPALPTAPAETNTSLRPEALEFLRRVGTPRTDAAAEAAAALLPPDERVRAAQWRPPLYLRAFLSREFEGRGLLPSRAEAEAFLAGFAESNEWVRANFFPDRPTLFHDRFDRYPEIANEPDLAAVLEVALAVTRLQFGMIGETLIDRCLAAAAASQAKGRQADMIKHFLKALEIDPAHERALDEFVAAVGTADEVATVRRFLENAPLSRKRRAAVEKALAEREGAANPGGAGENAAVSARRAARMAARRAARQGGAAKLAGSAEAAIEDDGERV